MFLFMALVIVGGILFIADGMAAVDKLINGSPKNPLD